MNWSQDQIETIAAMGYTETEARFLYLVATHSGYFTLRQFLAFSGAHYGKRSTHFAQKLLRKGHASMRDYLGAGSVFHLFSRNFYGRIEKDSTGNHRRHSFEYIRTRLVLLDFVLENLDCTFLETEQDKVRFFCETLAVPEDALPAKVYEGGPQSRRAVRYFVDKFPLFVDPPVSPSSPVVTFSYIDSGSASIASFGAHLAAYQALFRHLGAFRYVYVAPRTAPFARAEKRFQSFVKQPLETDVVNGILRYFLIRKKWERHEYVVPVTEDFEFLAEARLRFHDERFEDLYHAWLAGTVDEGALRAEFSQSSPSRRVSFDTYLVRNGASPVDELPRRHVSIRMKDAEHPRFTENGLKSLSEGQTCASSSRKEDSKERQVSSERKENRHLAKAAKA
jgi:hypothetical protein